MLKYILKRVAVMIPILIGVVFVIFYLLNILPGDPVLMLMHNKIKPDVIENLRERMHLNDPWYLRFVKYIGDAVLKGDLGYSYHYNLDVRELIAQAFPNTVRLTLAALAVSWTIGIPTGIVAAVKKNSLLDTTLMSFSLAGISVPVFWIGLLMQYIFAYSLHLLPTSGFSSLKHLILPAFVLGWASSGSIARMTRTNLLEVMKNDYVRTARSKGLAEWAVVFKHALRNSMLPVVTMMATQVSSLLSGAVVTETIFAIPGIGRLSVNAIEQRDMPLLQGTVIFTTVLIMLGNLFADIAYSFLDPRIRISGEKSES